LREAFLARGRRPWATVDRSEPVAPAELRENVVVEDVAELVGERRSLSLRIAQTDRRVRTCPIHAAGRELLAAEVEVDLARRPWHKHLLRPALIRLRPDHAVEDE